MKGRLNQNELIFNYQAVIFLKIAELRSFSKAAKFFGLTQGAVSRSISDWENKWGFSLFDRTKRPVSLTAEGNMIQHKLRQFAGSLNDLALSLQSDNFSRPTLRLGCVESMSLDLLPALSLKLLPQIGKLTTIIGTSNILTRLLKEGSLDFIICSDPGTEVRDLAITEVFQEGSIVVLPKGMENVGLQKSWEALSLCGLPFIKYHHASGGGKLNETFLHSLGITFINKLEADSNSTVLSMIASGLGWTIARPSTILQLRGFRSKLTVCPMPAPLLRRKLYVVSNMSESQKFRKIFINITTNILQNKLLKELLDIAPWLESEIKILDQKSGELKSRAQFENQ